MILRVIVLLLLACIQSKDWCSIFITAESRQAAMATITSMNIVIKTGKQPFSDINCDRKHLEEDKVFHVFGYNRFLPRNQAFTTDNKISKTEQIHNLRVWLPPKFQPRVQLEIAWWRCDSYDSTCMHTVSVATGSDLITHILLPHEKPPNPNQSNQALLEKFNFS